MSKELTPLEALLTIKLTYQIFVNADKRFKDKTTENCLSIIEKSLKALEILRKKIIPYSPLNRTMIQRAFDEGWITQEDFNLLKEVLL